MTQSPTLKPTSGRINLASAMFLAAALAAGCGDDDPAMMMNNDAGNPPADAGQPDSGVTAAPVINSVAWEPVGACTPGMRSEMQVTVDVTDDDTALADLTFSGSVTNCTGALTSSTSTVSCPQANPYDSTVMVEDPEGNMDSADFTVGVCETSSVSFGG